MSARTVWRYDARRTAINAHLVPAFVEPAHCGDHAPWPNDPSKGCVLPAGHGGRWHRSARDTEWDFSMSDLAVA